MKYTRTKQELIVNDQLYLFDTEEEMHEFIVKLINSDKLKPLPISKSKVRYIKKEENDYEYL